MYALMRHESHFYPYAISSVGALGLFQIMPDTFKDEKDCWKLREHGPEPRPESYLFNPVLNTQFWACWVKKNIEYKTRYSIVLIVVKHNAGPGTLGELRTDWKRRAIDNDLELQIDTLPYPATQRLVRNVLADVAIVDASGLFETGVGNGRGVRP